MEECGWLCAWGIQRGVVMGEGWILGLGGGI